MLTQTLERQELHQAIDMLSDSGVLSAFNFIKSLQVNNDDDFYNPANIRWLEHSLEQAKQGKVIVKTMEELERMADEYNFTVR